MGIKDVINAQAEADRIKFEKEQSKRITETKVLSDEMGERGVPEGKRPI